MVFFFAKHKLTSIADIPYIIDLINFKSVLIFFLSETALILAALNGHTEVVRALLKAGANPFVTPTMATLTLSTACWKLGVMSM